ncbi:uncharacterized protein LOC120346277 [Styela clava]
MSSYSSDIFHELSEYTAPSWVGDLKILPKRQVTLAVKPTPIHRWNITEIPEDYTIYIKRDDLTGCSLSGSKVRKLEFLLADAMVKGYKSVITGGTTQSNHSRATLVAARQLGLDCHLVLRSREEIGESYSTSGNFIMMEAGSPNIYILPWQPFTTETFENYIKHLAKYIGETTKSIPYHIPCGGDNELAIFGYISAWEELMKQKVHERYDDIVFANGTSGTAIGLGIGNYLTGSKLKIHPVLTSSTIELVQDKMDKTLCRFGLDVKSKDLFDIIDGYIGGGYNVYTKEDVIINQSTIRTTGIYCDPVYVGKALKGLKTELRINPGRFKGKRILFIHTGGTFGMMEKDIAKIIHTNESTKRIKQWCDVFPTFINTESVDCLRTK